MEPCLKDSKTTFVTVNLLYVHTTSNKLCIQKQPLLLLIAPLITPPCPFFTIQKQPLLLLIPAAHGQKRSMMDIQKQPLLLLICWCARKKHHSLDNSKTTFVTVNHYPDGYVSWCPKFKNNLCYC